MGWTGRGVEVHLRTGQCALMYAGLLNIDSARRPWSFGHDEHQVDAILEHMLLYASL